MSASISISMIGFILFMLLMIFIHGSIFGLATNRVLENKGYDDNWFWWGFFFGLIALFVALSKPENHYTSTTSYSDHPLMKQTMERDTLNNGGWKCYYCTSINAFNVTSCACGHNREDTERQNKNIANLKASRAAAKSKATTQSAMKEELNTIDIIAKYKELLDSGAITQEEFETKKKSLLEK